MKHEHCHHYFALGFYSLDTKKTYEIMNPQFFSLVTICSRHQISTVVSTKLVIYGDMPCRSKFSEP